MNNHKMNNSKMKYTGTSFTSNATNKDPNYSTQSTIAGGERVKVAVRLRPMQPHELQRNDQAIVSPNDQTHVLLNLRQGVK